MDTSVSQDESQVYERRLNGFALASVLVALLLTLLLEALDQTVVGTALPKIIGSLQGFDRYSWAVTAYILASATLIPIVGKLSDMFGRKGFLIGGTALFLLGSVLSGASQDMNQLIVFRAIQGLGAGIGIALAATVVGDIFPPQERARWQGLFGAVYGISSVIGPSLGGYLADHGPLLGNLVTETTRWRWVFYINLPLGIVALTMLIIFLPANISARSKQHTELKGRAALRRIDFLGAILSAAATISLLLGLTWGSNQTYSWTSPQVLGILIVAAVLFGVFLLAERSASEPILPFDLFRNRTFAIASILSLLQFMVLISLVINLPFFLQGVLGMSATGTGLALTPLNVASVVGAMLASMAVMALKRFRIVTVISSLILIVGMFLLTRMSTTSSTLYVILAMVLAGLGLGTFFSVLQLAAQNSLPRTRLGVGTGFIRYAGSLGSVLGLAIVGTVINSSLSSELAPRLAKIAGAAYLPAPVLRQATDPQTLISPAIRQGLLQGVAQHTPAPFQAQAVQTLNQVFDALKASLAGAVLQGLVAILVLCFLILVFSLLLKDVPLQATRKSPKKVEENEMLEALVSE
ncbi:MAG TPA: MFS transporter [Ktedonobacteraceae bacterium]|nr:MFS transporter [Ktedonobacteraceae bacterium]